MDAGESPAEAKQSAYSCSEAEETLLRELCAVNGVSYDKLAVGYGAKVLRLEIFFFGCPKIAGLHHFPNLRVLCIVNQRFGCISGLETCCNLQELWICETQVQRIEGLRHCRDLTELYLYSNQISQIEGLEGLTKLTKLWLNGNRISAIEGLDTLTQLRDLNLSGNAIKSIGHSLDSLCHLEVLRLSGNRLTSLQELVGLCSLSQLHTLSLCDPAYPPNPVCRLCNYSTHILYHLPHLHWLDDREVKGHQLQQVVQGLVSSKKLYYRMMEHQAKMACLQECKALHDKQISLCEPTLTCIRKLTQHIKSLQLSSDLDGKKVAKCELLVKRRRKLMDYIGLVERCRRDACELARQWTQQQCRQCSIELESGGNIRFTAGEPSLSSWYKSCSDLVNSRFSVDNTRDVGVNVTGIQVKAITRVENRMLYNRFNDKVHLILDEEVSSSVGKHQFDYLFLVWQSGQCYVDVSKDGLYGTGPVSLSNSVNMADAPRLEEILSWQNQPPAIKLAKLLNGQLLLCKIFTGRGLEEMKEVRRQHQQSNAESAARQWSVLDPDLVLPEYIIHFSYVSQLNSKDILDIMLLEQSPSPEGSDFIQAQPNLEGGEELSPPTPGHPRLAMLDAATVLQITSQPNLSSVKELILHDHRLSRFRLSSSLSNLIKLVLSFNELTVADDFNDMPNLQVLDISFNKLSSLRGMKGLPSLVQLDISWNQLKSYHHDVAILRHHAPSLSSLDASNNPWSKASGFRVHALGRLRSLRYLDAQQVTKEEASAAAKQVTSSHLSLTSLVGVASTASAPPPSLSLLPIAEQLHCHSSRTEHVLDSHTVSAKDWPSKVTSVALCNAGLCRLSCLDQLPNLRWLSLSDNALSSLEGLSLCSRLEELSVDRNLLENAAGVEGLLHLNWLSLSSNRLTELPSLRSLNQLSYFNFSDNFISSLTNLKSVASLVELYASSNSISDVRQLFCLKSLLHLVVVDFTYNPIVSTSNYRLFTIYHLSFIRALDAQPVESGELASAREKFGGRLTQDLITEKYPDIQFSSLRTLDLVQSGLKAVDLSPAEAFDNLASLNLEHNSLSSFSGLVYLNKLKVLCLNHNRIECMQSHHSSRDSLPSSSQVLNSLEVLHLAYNGIVNLVPLQLGRISSLRALFLQGNEIVHVDGLSGLESLTELVLDRNKIKSLHESSFNSLYNLRELHLEENRLKELSHLSTSLSHLERLYLGMNRLQEFSELEKLSGLTELMELSIVSNPVSRRLQHRSLLIFHLPSLLSLDGVMVTADERHVAQVTFGSFHELHEVDDIGDIGSGMPSLGHATPLKVLTVPFAQFGHSYHSQHKQNARMQPEPPAYFQQLRKGRTTN